MTGAPRSGEQLLPSGDAEICVQTFGSRADPPILLIGGATASMDWWEDEFCEQLAGVKRYVVRYDNRDTGRSTSYEAGKPGYGWPEMTTDALAVLDGLGLRSAHLVGLSMGGGIAQEIAIDHPSRVSTLTLMSTSPGGPGGPDNPDLPPPEPRITALFSDPAPGPDWAEREAAIEAMTNGERPFGGSIPFDAERVRQVATRAFDRTTNVASSQTNHWILDGGEPTRPRLPNVTAPTLILHGTEDPLFPFGHAEALAREIPGARLVPLEGMGHQYPPPQLWGVVVSEIVPHTA